MDMKEINSKKLELSEKIRLLENEMDLLNNLEEAQGAEILLKVIKFTKWELDAKEIEIVYKPMICLGSKKTELQSVVFDTLKLWPHGQIYIDKLIKLICDDGTIIIKVSDDVYSNVPENKDLMDYIYEVLFDFINKNNLLVDFDQYNELTKDTQDYAIKRDEKLKKIKGLYKGQ